MYKWMEQNYDKFISNYYANIIPSLENIEEIFDAASIGVPETMRLDNDLVVTQSRSRINNLCLKLRNFLQLGLEMKRDIDEAAKQSKGQLPPAIIAIYNEYAEKTLEVVNRILSMVIKDEKVFPPQIVTMCKQLKSIARHV